MEFAAKEKLVVRQIHHPKQSRRKIVIGAAPPRLSLLFEKTPVWKFCARTCEKAHQ